MGLFMTIRVLVNGAQGKMGQFTVAAIQGDSGLTLVGQTGHGDSLADEIKKSKADVVVDFTQADVVLKNTKTIIESGAHPVIGTSGLVQEQVDELKKLCAQKKLGGIIAPNFSIGAVLMMKHAQNIAKYFPDVEIIEMHHPGKLDSPSGTAVRTAELLSASRQTTPAKKNSIRETVPGARGANYLDIPIHAVRLSGLVAHQQIIFGGSGETLTLRHDSIDRLCFMPGVLLACKKVMELKELIFGLEHIL
jgi:4-hydroxy-tetrahydrodipicolinate reductase